MQPETLERIASSLERCAQALETIAADTPVVRNEMPPLKMLGEPQPCESEHQPVEGMVLVCRGLVGHAGPHSNGVHSWGISAEVAKALNDQMHQTAPMGQASAAKAEDRSPTGPSASDWHEQAKAIEDDLSTQEGAKRVLGAELYIRIWSLGRESTDLETVQALAALGKKIMGGEAGFRREAEAAGIKKGAMPTGSDMRRFVVERLVPAEKQESASVWP